MQTLKTGREEEGGREGGRREGGREGGREEGGGRGRRQNTLPEMPPVLLIGRVEPTHQSGTSYQYSAAQFLGKEQQMEGGKREKREKRER